MDQRVESAAGERLVSLYRRYVGEPDRLRDVYLGFGLFFGGIALGVVGLLVFLAGNTYPNTSLVFYQFREIAIALGGVGLPAFLVSITVLLPVGRRTEYAAALGGLITVVAVGIFVTAYPYHWNVGGASDRSVVGVSTYALGLAVMVAAIGAALVSDYIERQNATAAPASGNGDAAARSEGSGESVSDANVERDIEDAMKDADLSWGGVQKDNTKRLKIKTDEGEAGIDRANFDTVGGNERREGGNGVDDAVNSLNSFRGGQQEEARSEGTADDQADKLRQLRERQRAEAEKEAAEEGLIGKLKRRLP